MKQRIQINQTVRAFLLDPDKMPDSIRVHDRLYNVVEPAGSGFKGVVWKVTDEFGKPKALKLTIAEDYDDRSYLAEIRLAAKLEDYGFFASVLDAGNIKFPVDGQDCRFVVFLESWIDGSTLENFIENNSNEISATFLEGYVETFCSILNALRQEELQHDDLHFGNVMVQNPLPGDLDQ